MTMEAIDKTRRTPRRAGPTLRPFTGGTAIYRTTNADLLDFHAPLAPLPLHGLLRLPPPQASAVLNYPSREARRDVPSRGEVTGSWGRSRGYGSVGRLLEGKMLEGDGYGVGGIYGGQASFRLHVEPGGLSPATPRPLKTS